MYNSNPQEGTHKLESVCLLSNSVYSVAIVFCGWLQIPFLLWFLVYSELHSYTNIQGWQNNQYHSHIESATTLSDNYDILYLLVEYCWIDIKTTNW